MISQNKTIHFVFNITRRQRNSLTAIERKTEGKIKLFHTKVRILQTCFVILHLLVDSTFMDRNDRNAKHLLITNY